MSLRTSDQAMYNMGDRFVLRAMKKEGILSLEAVNIVLVRGVVTI